MLDAIFRNCRWFRHWRGGTWTRWHVVLPHWRIDYACWERVQPPECSGGSLTILAVEVW